MSEPLFGSQKLDDELWDWVVAKYGKPDTTWDKAKFHAIVDDVVNTFDIPTKKADVNPQTENDKKETKVKLVNDEMWNWGVAKYGLLDKTWNEDMMDVLADGIWDEFKDQIIGADVPDSSTKKATKEVASSGNRYEDEDNDSDDDVVEVIYLSESNDEAEDDEAVDDDSDDEAEHNKAKDDDSDDEWTSKKTRRTGNSSRSKKKNVVKRRPPVNP